VASSAITGDSGATMDMEVSLPSPHQVEIQKTQAMPAMMNAATTSGRRLAVVRWYTAAMVTEAGGRVTRRLGEEWADYGEGGKSLATALTSLSDNDLGRDETRSLSTGIERV
jgi:hypothetical protein